MTGITFLKNLQSENVTLLQLLNAFVFGDKKVQPYDSNKVYNTGDMILITNEDTGKIEIYQTMEDGITGEFNPYKWSSTIVSDTVSSNIDEVVMLTPNQPVSKNNFVWFQPLQYRTGELPEPFIEEINDMTTLFSLDAFPIVDETVPDGEDVGLFFDIEGTSEGSTELVEDEFADSTVKTLDEPDDVRISDTPVYDPETMIWGDTDLTDNI